MCPIKTDSVPKCLWPPATEGNGVDKGRYYRKPRLPCLKSFRVPKSKKERVTFRGSEIFHIFQLLTHFPDALLCKQTLSLCPKWSVLASFHMIGRVPEEINVS